MMSPGRPNLRNRKKIKAPKRLEDEYEYEYGNTSPARQESPGEASEESSELEEETYKSPKPKTPKSKKRPAYRGKVSVFNPNLPPAAFPTLDHPSYVHNGGTVPFDLESHSLGLKSQELAGYGAINPHSLGRDPHSEETDLTENFPVPTSTTADFTHRDSTFAMQRSKKGQKQARGNVPSKMHLGPNDNGPQNPIWASNMARMVEAGKMSDLDRIMLEMETSDEEDAATDTRSKVARKNSAPKYPAWDDLTVAHKLDLADTIAEFDPDPAHVMHQLRLNPSQKEELTILLIERQDRAAREKANQQTLMSQTKEMLLRGEPLPQSKFHQMVEENLYENIQQDHHIQTNLMELKKARAYLEYCGFDPALADSNWDVPSISDVAEPSPAQAPPSPSEEKESSSSRPALSTSFQKAPHLPDPHPNLGQQQQTQVLTSQYHPNTAAHAQQSPLAPLSSVPIQSHRAVPPPCTPNNPQLDKSLFVPGRSHAVAHKGVPPIAQANQYHQSSTDSNARTSAPQGHIDTSENKDLANKKKRKKVAK